LNGNLLQPVFIGMDNVIICVRHNQYFWL